MLIGHLAKVKWQINHKETHDMCGLVILPDRLIFFLSISPLDSYQWFFHSMTKCNELVILFLSFDWNDMEVTQVMYEIYHLGPAVSPIWWEMRNVSAKRVTQLVWNESISCCIYHTNRFIRVHRCVHFIHLVQLVQHISIHRNLWCARTLLSVRHCMRAQWSFT